MKRYEFDAVVDGFTEILKYPHEQGDWVEYEDAALLYQQLKDVIGALKDVLRGDDGEADIHAERVLVCASKVLEDLK